MNHKFKSCLLVIFTILSFTTFCLAQNQKVKVKIHSIEGYLNYEEFARKAAALLEDTLNSEEFKAEVLKRKFDRTKGLSNPKLYERIMQAHEQQGDGGEDYVVDLRLRTLDFNGNDSEWRKRCQEKTIGVDGAGTGVTAICPNKLELYSKTNDTAALARHYAHEYIHILGFDHNVWFSKRKTFVYQIGSIVEELANKK